MNRTSMRIRRIRQILAMAVICSLAINNNMTLLASEAADQTDAVYENQILSENDAVSADETVSEDSQISDNTVSDDKTDEEDTGDVSISDDEIVSENEAETVSEDLAGEEEPEGAAGTIIESGSTGEISYNIIEKADGNYKLVISGNGKMGDYDTDSYYINGNWYYPTSAPWGKYCTVIDELDLQNGCTYIGKYAFYRMDKIQSVLTIPSSVATISNNAFYECTGFTGVTLSNNLEKIGEKAFYRCTGMRGQLILPGHLFEIGKSAFQGCEKLTGLTLLDGIKIISSNAFDSCSSMIGSLTIPNSITTIGTNAFSGCTGFSSLVLSNNLKTIERSVFSGCLGMTGQLIIPEGVTDIDQYAFFACKNFRSLSLPNGLKTIGECAFNGCSEMSGQLTIPGTVIDIGLSAFSGCKSFTGQLVLPEGLKTIKNGTFSGCSGFTGKLVLPDGLDSIETNAFLNCNGLSGELDLPSGLTQIGSGAFENCKGFNGNIVIPSGVKTVSDRAFGNCSGLDGKLTVSSGVISIGNNAFMRTQFTEMDLGEGLQSIGDEVFGSETYGGSCKVYGRDLLPASIKSVGTEAFWGCINGEINIPASLTQIGKKAFYSPKLTGFIVNNNNSEYSDIDGVLFNKDKTTLISYPQNKYNSTYVIPNSTTSLSEYSFYNCRNLFSLTVPNGVSFPYSSIISDSWYNSIKFLFMSDVTAPAIAHASAIYASSALKIYVPENATGYDVKPWSDYTVVKAGYIKPESIALSERDVILDNKNGPYYKEIYYSIKPSNASTKRIIINNSNSSLVYCSSSTKNDGTPYIYVEQYSSTIKPGTATITVTTDDGYASTTIDVTLVNGGSSGGEDPVTEGEHTVLFKNDGEFYEKQVVKHGQTATKPATDPTKAGYTFVGWANGNSIWNFSTPITTDLILNAKFTPNTISGNDPSGSGKDSIPTVTADNKIYLVVGQTYFLGEKGYKSSNTKAATVDKNTGKITAKAAEQGNALISNGSKEYLVMVQKPYFSTSNKKVNILVGKNYKLQLSGIESAYTMFYPISWESSNEKIATVNNGMVTALAKGKAYIYAYVGGKRYKAQVVIKDTYSLPSTFSSTQTINVNPLATVKLKYQRKVFVPKNATWTGTTSDNALTEIKNKSGKVVGYKNSVVEIYKNGKVKGIGPGTTTLSGKDVNTATVTLTVNVYPVSAKGTVYINKEKSEQLKYANVDNSKAEWLLNDAKTQNNGILWINNKGKVKALSVGQTKVSCVYKGFTFNTMVYVEDPGLATDEKLTQNGNAWKLSLKKNDVYTVRTKGIYQTPVWSSKNKKIAFVDENGTIYARKKGTATVSTKINGKAVKVIVTVSE